jgi:hypothetical protein
MKKCGALILVFALASTASGTLSWDPDYIELVPYVPDTVYIVSDSDGPYPSIWIDDEAGLITSIVPLPASDPPARVQDPAVIGGPYWTVESGMNPVAGNHFLVTLEATSAHAGNTYHIYLDTYGVNDDLTVNVLPEPASVFMLALGGLALLRRRRK